MNKYSVFVIGLLFSATLHGQTVTVKKQSEQAKGESVEGYSTELEGKKDLVNTAWTKYLKEIGKLKQSSDPMLITEPVFNGLSFSKGTVYAVIRDKGENTYVWLGIMATEWETNDVKRINNELEKAVRQFGIKYYKDKIQVQIDEAQKAFDAVEKQKQRIANQTKDLNIQLGNNEQEKVALTKSIDLNKVESVSIQEKLVKNTKAQDSLAAAGVQIQKVKLMHIERQKKVKGE